MALNLNDSIDVIKALSGLEFFEVTQKSNGAVLWAAMEDTVSFHFTGTIQEYVVPMDGIYQLEVYGAQGGDGYSGKGGKGGYSKGSSLLKKGEKLYIVVGGSGDMNTSGETAGGFNGGGDARSGREDQVWRCGSGGGATHIAKTSGLLSSLEGNKESILLVAGGGGGAGGSQHYSDANGGAGGGISGGKGTGSASGEGGTQSAGGTGNASYYGVNGSFGQGGNKIAGTYCGAGGGGGYYGGGSGAYYNGGSAAGGGSGYIGGIEDGETTEGWNIGDGWAKIVFLRRNVLYENGALTELGEKYVTELETSKTFRPAANTGYASTGFYPIKLNEHLNLKITWDIVLGIAGGKGDVFGITLNGKQEYSYTDNGTASYLSTGIETISENVNEVLALLTCSNKGTTDTSYIKVTINKIEII